MGRCGRSSPAVIASRLSVVSGGHRFLSLPPRGSSRRAPGQLVERRVAGFVAGFIPACAGATIPPASPQGMPPGSSRRAPGQPVPLTAITGPHLGVHPGVRRGNIWPRADASHVEGSSRRAPGQRHAGGPVLIDTGSSRRAPGQLYLQVVQAEARFKSSLVVISSSSLPSEDGMNMLIDNRGSNRVTIIDAK